MSKRYSIFLTALFCAFLGGMALLSLLLPKESFSELENRYLQKAPTLSLSAIESGKFMEEAEDYVSDHIAGRDFWVALKAWSERLSGKGENEGVYFGKEDTLLNRVADPDEERLSQAMNYLNRLAEQSEVPTYFGVIPTSSAIWHERLPKGAPTADEESAIRELNGESRAAVVDIYDALTAHAGEDVYYRTDHHWTADGAYYAYEAYCESKDLLPISRGRHEKREFDGFLGSFYNDTKSKKLQKHPDTVTAYEPISKNISMVCEEANGSKPTYKVIYDVSKHPASLKYNAFLAGDHAYSKITNEDLTDGSSCVVVKESFGNAFVPFLVDHYQTVHVIDYRYWNQDLISFVEKKQADDLIFVNNLSMIRSDYLTGRLAQLINK